MSQVTGAPGNKPGMAERAKAKTAERANAVIVASLGPDEHVRTGARVQAGASQWWIVLSTYVRFFQHYYYMALTDRNVVLCGLSVWTGRPKKVKIVTPRDQVRIADYQPGTVFASFRYLIPDRKKPMRMRAGRGWRPEIEALLTELGVLAPAAPAPATAPAPAAPAPAAAPARPTADPLDVLTPNMPPPAGPVLDTAVGQPPPYDTGQ
jgi:hypothetical protein